MSITVIKNIWRVALSVVILLLLILWGVNQRFESTSDDLSTSRFLSKPKVRSSFSPKNTDDALSRVLYERNRLKDPNTGLIPENIREKELAFVRNIPQRQSLEKGNGIYAADWQPRGPYNVGGRTRALAIDLDYNGSSNRRILAGGISGGMYLSEDGGASWVLKTALDANASVTCLVQDPANRNVFYYGTGEYLGNSAAGGGNFMYLGHGIFKSTDRGNSWSQLPSTINNNDPHDFDQFMDVIWNLAIHPTNSQVYAATYGAILRSEDGGQNWTQILGRSESPFSNSSDVAIASNGDVYAVLGRHGAQISEYGVFRLPNGGNSWSDISPPGLVADPQRMVLDTAPSDPNTVYVLVQVGNGESAAEHQLFRYNAGTTSWTNLSGSIVDFPDAFGGIGKFSSQGGYDLIVKVKPDNPNVFWIGGTNILRSVDGGQNYTWVAGYHPQQFLYPNHHPDQHSMAFFPNNPNSMVSGHDGGLSLATDVMEEPQSWTSLNNGYLTTQFYTMAVDPLPGSNLLLGGLQDNGTWITETVNPTESWGNPFGGDGSYAAVTPGGNPIYASSQNGNIFRITLQGNQSSYTKVTPTDAQNFQFIAPFVWDPHDARVMYLAAGNQVWRNSDLSGIPEGGENNTSINWSPLSNSAVSSTQVTTLAMAKTPANRLYFGTTDFQSITVLKRVDNAPSNPSGTTITPNVTQGANPSCIAVNPQNGDEIMAIFSNYGVQSVWYSSNAGASWSDVEGNLGGQSAPSIRWAAIMPSTSGKVFFLATSAGVYSTTNLNSTNTVWQQEGAGLIGNVVTDMITIRPEDGLVVAATHGRGVYSATVGVSNPAVAGLDVTQLDIELQPGQTRSKSFVLSNLGEQALNYTVTVSGFTQNVSSQYRAVLDPSVDVYPFEPPSDAGITGSKGSASAAGATIQKSSHQPPTSLLTDVLLLDDGNDMPDDFIGTNDFLDFYWANEFNLSSSGFDLEEMNFYMRTEQAFSNEAYVGVFKDLNGTALVEGTLSFPLSQDGAWFTVTLTPAIQFNAGETFYLVVGASGIIGFPAGTDFNASIPNKSYYLDTSSNTWVNLNTVSGLENGAFLVRATGTLSGGGNTAPTAVATVPAQGLINVSIPFDGSQSFDTDGQITQYLWNFGDGNSSNQAVANHSFSAANSYNWSLTVTDNQGATGQATGQIVIAADPPRLTVNPSSGSVGAGGSATLTATFDAQGLSEGSYQGQINISSNGGNIILPVSVNVSNTVGLDDQLLEIETFALAQNYPNPFNPTTAISYQLPAVSSVKLVIYNSLGQQVKTLVSATQSAGRYTVQWDATNDLGQGVASGIYLYRIQAGANVQVRKMLLTR